MQQLFSKLRTTLAYILVLLSLNVFAQDIEYERTITLAEMFEEIKNCKEEQYKLYNTIITTDKYLFDDTLTIEIPIKISRCRYANTMLPEFSNITFKKLFDIHKTEDLGIFFTNCTFEGRHAWRFGDVPNAYYKNCTFNGEFLSFNTSGGLHFKSCIFDHKGTHSKYGDPSLEIFPWNEVLTYLSIKECEFYGSDDTASVQIYGNIEKVRLNDNQFNVKTAFTGLNTQNSFVMQQCEFKYPVGLHETVFNESQTNVKFSQLEGFKIALYPYGLDSIVYMASDDSQLTDTIPENPYLFNSLMSVYSKLFNTYKYRGDRESANACYIEMKDIETRKMKYDYEVNPSFNNYLDYRLNSFLKYFADYGTNPTRSLSISIKVILLFSFFYFFFYSEWDRIDRTFLMKRFRGLFNYFRQNQTMEEVYHADHDGERLTFEDFKRDIDKNSIDLPFFIRLLAKPLYQLSLLRHNIIKWFYKKADIRQRKWSSLKPLRKFMVGSTVGLAMVGYSIWLIAIRTLNSVVLSVNAFSTLGFGDIPVKGLSRYIAILEGFLGWFLLSIFSVSLISQILQN